MNKFDWHCEPAFARPISANANNGDVQWEQRGLSAWDYFAAAALTGICAHGVLMPNEHREATAQAAAMADAMMLERATRSADAHAESQKPVSSASTDLKEQP